MEIMNPELNVDQMIHRRSDCRLCHSSNLELVLQLKPSALANEFVKQPVEQAKFPLDLFQCLDCEHYQLLDIVNPEILFKNYLYVSGTSQLMRDHFNDYAKEMVQRYLLTENDLVIDIGSNDSTLLKSFKNLGIKVVGVEPATNLASKSNQDGIKTYNNFFNQKTAEEIIINEGKASLITCNNCFAHTDDLDEIILGAKKLLKYGGRFVFEVSYFADVIKNYTFDQLYHEHLDFHHVAPLHKFLTKHNLALEKVKYLNIHGGSIRCYVKNIEKYIERKGQPKIPKDVSSIIQSEIDLGLHDRKVAWSQVPTFLQKIEENKNILKEKLLELKSQGARIGAVAASAKSTTFLHHYELNKNIIEFICDDAPEKVGLLSSGLHIPIVPFSRENINKVDYLLILSFNFTESIIKNHPEFLGKWICPLPEFKIYEYT